MNEDGQKLDLDYPCAWGYRVIAADEAALRCELGGCMGEKEYSLSVSNTSRAGKYTSFSLELTVEDEDARLGLFRVLSELPSVKMVL